MHRNFRFLSFWMDHLWGIQVWTQNWGISGAILFLNSEPNRSSVVRTKTQTSQKTAVLTSWFHLLKSLWDISAAPMLWNSTEKDLYYIPFSARILVLRKTVIHSQKKTTCDLLSNLICHELLKSGLSWFLLIVPATKFKQGKTGESTPTLWSACDAYLSSLPFLTDFGFIFLQFMF